MQGLKAGDYRVRVTACDAAGNKASATAKLAWAPDGASTSVVGGANTVRYRLTELWMTSPGKPRTKVTETRSALLRMGQRIRLEGVLEQVNGKRSTTAVTLYDSAGTQVGTAASDANGHFYLNATVARGGTWRVAAQYQDQILAHVKLRVPAGVVQQVNTHTLHLGDTLVVTGRLTPGPLAANGSGSDRLPSTSNWPPCSCGANRKGRAMLARSALTSDPSRSCTLAPLRAQVA